MAYRHSGVLITDHLKSINLSALNKRGLLKPGVTRTIPYRWFNYQGQCTGVIQVTSSIQTTRGTMTLEYVVNDEHIKCDGELLSKPSNLNRGRVWYFVCPVSGRLCRKLYRNGNRFTHRTELVASMYEIQTLSARARSVDKVSRDVLNRDPFFAELLKKHSKKVYRGKHTKRFAKLLRRLRVIQGFSVDQYHNLLVTGRL